MRAPMHLVLIVASSLPAAALACSGRPGTPNHVTATKLGLNRARVEFENRASEGSMFYDIQAFDLDGVRLLKNYTGVRESRPANIGSDIITLDGRSCPAGVLTDRAPDGTTTSTPCIAVPYAALAGYGQRTYYDMADLPLTNGYCFRVRARTEGGAEGCVSELWSANACVRTGTSDALRNRYRRLRADRSRH